MHRAAGVDVSYRGNSYFAALAAFSDGSPEEFRTETGFSPEPYRSKLFFIKEAPIISRLVYGQNIDLLFVNGHGICHPYHFGLATVVGITHKVATIGVARRLVKGEYDWRASRCEGVRFIVQSGRPVGAAVRRRPGDSPIFISPGYGIGVVGAVFQYFTWVRGGKVPEPLRLAHLEARRLMRAALL